MSGANSLRISQRRAVTAIVALALIAGAIWVFVLGGGGNLAAEAATEGEAACAAKTRETAMEHTRWYSEVSAIRADERDALSAEDRAAYEGHRIAAFECMNALAES